jgi:hypothetical protein
MNTLDRFKRRFQSKFFWLPPPEKGLLHQPRGEPGGALILVLRLVAWLIRYCYVCLECVGCQQLWASNYETHKHVCYLLSVLAWLLECM